MRLHAASLSRHVDGPPVLVGQSAAALLATASRGLEMNVATAAEVALIDTYPLDQRDAFEEVSKGSIPHDTVDAPGDRLTMMQGLADDTAKLIRDWMLWSRPDAAAVQAMPPRARAI